MGPCRLVIFAMCVGSLFAAFAARGSMATGTPAATSISTRSIRFRPMIDPAAAIREIRRRRLRANNFIPHTPSAKQEEFLNLPGGENVCSEALYGGAAGGGNSDALLMAAAKYLHVPHYAALILRKSFKDLAQEDAIMARAQQWWLGNPDIHWDAKLYKFTFPAGSTITFGYLDAEIDKYQYQGAAFQCVCFDELTQFTESKYTYLLTRIRRPEGMPVPLRACAASNPGGVGHDWVFARFVDPKTAIAPFIPAKLDDNEHIDRAAYRATLQLVDPVTREQMLNGAWIRDGGGLVYSHYSAARNLIAAKDVPPLQYHIGALDFGVRDQNAFGVLGWRDNDPCIYILKAYRFTGLVEDVAREVRAADAIYHFVKIVGDVGGMGKLFQAELAARFSIPIDPAEKTNKLGYIRLFNGALANGHIRIAACEDTRDLLAEWSALPWDARGLKEVEGFANHASDQALYGWRATTAYHNEPADEKPARGSREAAEAEERELERQLTSDEREEVWA